jgi:hypothetical protein
MCNCIPSLYLGFRKKRVTTNILVMTTKTVGIHLLYILVPFLTDPFESMSNDEINKYNEKMRAHIGYFRNYLSL